MVLRYFLLEACAEARVELTPTDAVDRRAARRTVVRRVAGSRNAQRRLDVEHVIDAGEEPEVAVEDAATIAGDIPLETQVLIGHGRELARFGCVRVLRGTATDAVIVLKRAGIHRAD